jgi:hypothetical protein
MMMLVIQLFRDLAIRNAIAVSEVSFELTPAITAYSTFLN